MTIFHGLPAAVATVLLVAAGPAGAAPVPAAAAPRDGTGLRLTLVARVCDAYGDVMANLARDNNMQSLQNLGKDSVYSPGQPVSPEIEAANDPGCRPLTGWRFTLGRGIGGEVQGLSTVTPAPDGLAQATTRASVPELDSTGGDTGRTLQGAVTVDLDPDLTSVAQARRLQVQGGTPADPLNQQLFGDAYSFATLRCAVDNQRADNVDRAAYPAGTTHVFCYYYAVAQPPEAGTIVVRKHVVNSTAGAEPFTFTGTVSYTPDASFRLTAGPGQDGEESFRRAATAANGEPWTVAETVPAGWTLTGLDCSSAEGTSSTARDGARAAVRLAARDTVTCTYTDAPSATVAPLTLLKVTEGGAGGPFRFTTGSGTELGRATTGSAGTPVSVGTAFLDPGRHTVSETGPQGWQLTDVRCTGAEPTVHQAAGSFDLDLPAAGATCTVVNSPAARPTPAPTPSPTPLPSPSGHPAPTAAPSGQLPATGAPGPLPTALVSAALTLAGTLLLLLGRRRHRH